MQEAWLVNGDVELLKLDKTCDIETRHYDNNLEPNVEHYFKYRMYRPVNKLEENHEE